MKNMVSWVMPVYNSSKDKLIRAIDSMLNQTYTDFEIILVVEYGTDLLTQEICKEYVKKNQRITMICNEGKRLGIAESLNRGMKASNCKYIARMDADDYSYPDRLEWQIDYMEKHNNVGILGGNARVINEKSGKSYIRYTSSLNTEMVATSLLFGTCFIHPTIMIRNSIQGLCYPREFAEDYALFAQLINKVDMEIDSRVVLDYYDDQNSTSKSNFEKVRDDSARISQKAIFETLGIDTINFDKSLFGWRNRDIVDRDPGEYLKECLQFYKLILQTNREKQVFDEKSLVNTILGEWRKTLDLCFPYAFPELYRSVDTIDVNDIEQLFLRALEYKPNDRKVIAYGAGRILNEWFKCASKSQVKNIICVCDSDPTKQEKLFRGKRVISPEEIKNEDYDDIVISSIGFENAIHADLNERGILDKKIKSLPIPEVTAYGLKYYRNEILRYKQEKDVRRAFLFCSPDYGNIGDHAIAEAEFNYICKNNDIELLEVPFLYQEYLIPLLQKIIKPIDLIYITGGGFLGSLWYGGEKKVQDVVESFPENRIFIFPQTLYWENENDERIIEARRIYLSHKSGLVMCARDEITKKSMEKFYSGINVILAPDITLMNSWSEYYTKKRRNGCLICLKEDEESILSNSEKKRIVKILHQQFDVVNNDNNCTSDRFFVNERKKYIEKQLNKWASYKLVITDRLHGAIFSVITGTPCIILNNVNHKLRTGYACLRRVKNIFFAERLEQLEKYVLESSDFVAGTFDNSLWTNDFEELRCMDKRQYVVSTNM